MTAQIINQQKEQKVAHHQETGCDSSGTSPQKHIFMTLLVGIIPLGNIEEERERAVCMVWLSQELTAAAGAV